MGKSAVIIAERSDQRRGIAQRVSPLELFDQIHFSASLHELRLLLDSIQTQIIFSESDSSENQTLKATADLANLAEEHGCALCFFSDSDPGELLKQGLVPPDSHCFSYQISNNDLLQALQPLLRHVSDSTPSCRSRIAQNALGHNPGIYSRFYFDNFLNQELSRSKLTGRPFSLLLIEPQLSAPQHQTANRWDPFLPTIARAIKAQIRTSDLLCHVEQSRLALLLPETSTGRAEKVMARIHNNVGGPSPEHPLRLKIGLASSGTSNHYSSQTLLQKAAAGI